MGLILHLSDLHLGPGGGDRPTGDPKIPIIKEHDLQKRVQAAEATMRRVVERLSGRKFSAVVISGDIANRNNEEGFKQLERFLKSFEPSWPDDRRAFVVVPGNHDVAWHTPPSTSDRYKTFLKYVRDDLGATTPPLEGIDDLKDRGKHLKEQHYWSDKAEAWAILALNSSDYCGTWAGLYDIDDREYEQFVSAAISSALPKAKEILDRLDRFRSYDMARVSPQQLEVFQSQTAKAARELESKERAPLLLATLHHQLLPVADEEEIKPFEALTNLGQVRTALARQKINVLFHGHKHVPATYWDRQEEGGREVSHECLVVSGPTVCGEPYSANFAKSPCSIIEIETIPAGHRVSVRTAKEFIAEEEGFTTRFFSGCRFEPPAKKDGVAVVVAENFDEAYAKLQTLAVFHEDGPTTQNNVVVRIQDATSVLENPPKAYPVDVVDHPSELKSWFTNIANWWQRPISELSPDLYFTHGSRIRHFKSAENQLGYAYNAVRSTGSDEGNGRAIICLIDPEADFQVKKKRAAGWFPAFASVQFCVTRDAKGSRTLNVIGYYRKQEMRYWWPINVRELRLLLDEVAGKDFKIGSITTIAAIAIAGTGKPKVAVPIIDRWYDEDKALIANLVQLFVRAVQGAEIVDVLQQLKLWREILSDLLPPDPDKAGQLESIPIVTKGLGLVVTLLTSQAEHARSPNAKLTNLKDCLERISERQSALLHLVLNSTDGNHKEQYGRIWNGIKKETNAATAIIESVFNEKK